VAGGQEETPEEGTKEEEERGEARWLQKKRNQKMLKGPYSRQCSYWCWCTMVLLEEEEKK